MIQYETEIDGKQMFVVIGWPDCETSGCAHKVCTWGSRTLCYPCEEALVGEAEMNRRYDLTHEHAHDSNITPNPMVREYYEPTIYGNIIHGDTTSAGIEIASEENVTVTGNVMILEDK